MEFYKYHSLGNDYLVYDIRKNQEELDQEKIIRVCSRNFGIGSDGIVAGPYEKDGNFFVRVFNPDGTEAEQGGNASGSLPIISGSQELSRRSLFP